MDSQRVNNCSTSSQDKSVICEYLIWCRRINDIIIQYKGSFVLELQQRAIEFNSIIERHQNIRFVRFHIEGCSMPLLLL